MTVIFVLVGLFICEQIITRVFTNSWSKGLSVDISFEEEAVDEGKTGTITETFINDKKLMIPIVNVKFELDKNIEYIDKSNVSISDRQYRSDSMTLKPRKSYKRQVKVKFNKRGVYEMGDAVVSTRDLFCNYNYAEKYPSSSEIYVYPSYSRYTDLFAPFSRMVGEAIKNKFIYEDPFEFKGIRDYTGAEPMKKINWSASAKTGDLKVNNYYDTSSRHALLFLDIVNSQIWKQYDQIEECIRITRNYMEGFIRRHIPLEIITNGKDIFEKTQIFFDKGQDAGYVEQCLRKMARIDIDEPTESLAKYFEENQAKDDELCILLSVDQSPALIHAYEKFLGRHEGEWVCPISGSAERLIHSRSINVTYVEVGR